MQDTLLHPLQWLTYSQSADRGILGKQTHTIPEGAAELGFIRDQATNLQLLSMMYETPKRIWDSRDLTFVDP